jgi:hypothetical protein
MLARNLIFGPVFGWLKHLKTGQNDLVIACHSKTGPFDFRTQIDRLNIVLVRYWGCHCILLVELHFRTLTLQEDKTVIVEEVWVLILRHCALKT